MTDEEVAKLISTIELKSMYYGADEMWGKALQFIRELQAENAALRERLGKAVELPVKLGDPVYYLQYFCDYKGCDSTTQQFCCGCKEMIEREKSKEYYVIREKPFELKDLPKIGKKYFTTREAALARLAELKGGKE